MRQTETKGEANCCCSRNIDKARSVNINNVGQPAKHILNGLVPGLIGKIANSKVKRLRFADTGRAIVDVDHQRTAIIGQMNIYAIAAGIHAKCGFQGCFQIAKAAGRVVLERQQMGLNIAGEIKQVGRTHAQQWQVSGQNRPGILTLDIFKRGLQARDNIINIKVCQGRNTVIGKATKVDAGCQVLQITNRIKRAKRDGYVPNINVLKNVTRNGDIGQGQQTISSIAIA